MFGIETMAGAPVGNKNAIRNKPIRDAFERALSLHKPSDQREALDCVIKVVIAKAMDGDMQAAKEIFDRIDGKPPQSTEISGVDGGEILARIERVIIDRKNDSPSN
jgi:hypothetical protein